MELRLIVIRSPDGKRLAEFYSFLGFTFHYHKHGNSPYHYSATTGKTVIEIYPLSKSQTEADKHLRLGFAIDHFDEKINILKENNVKFLVQPGETDFGFMTIIEDPDERKIELYKN